MEPMEDTIHGRHGSKNHPTGSQASLKPSKHVWTYDWHFLDSVLVQTVIKEGLTYLWLSTSYHPPHHPPTYPAPIMCHQCYYSGCEKVLKIQPVLAS